MSRVGPWTVVIVLLLVVAVPSSRADNNSTNSTNHWCEFTTTSRESVELCAILSCSVVMVSGKILQI